MPFDGGAIAIRQATPGDEPHYADLIIQQDRRARTIQGALDRSQCEIVDGLEAGRALQLLGELVKRGLLLHAASELLFRLLAVVDVLLNPNRVKKRAILIADAGRRH